MNAIDPIGAMLQHATLQHARSVRLEPTLDSVMRDAATAAHEADAHQDRDASKALWAIHTAAEALHGAVIEIRQQTTDTGSNPTTVAAELNDLLQDVRGGYATRRNPL